MNLVRRLDPASYVLVVAGAYENYRYTACAWLSSTRRAVYSTTINDTGNVPRGSPAILGLLDLDNNSLSSLTFKHRYTNITCIRTWQRGILFCCTQGLVYVDLAKNLHRILVNSFELSGRIISGCAVNQGDATIWITCITDSKVEDSHLLFCYDTLRSTLTAISTENTPIVEPSAISWAPRTQECFICCRKTDLVFVVKFNELKIPISCQRFTYILTSPIIAMKADVADNLFIATNYDIFCWNKYGCIVTKFHSRSEIVDFVLTDSGVLVLHDASWTQFKFNLTCMTPSALQLHEARI